MKWNQQQPLVKTSPCYLCNYRKRDANTKKKKQKQKQKKNEENETKLNKFLFKSSCHLSELNLQKFQINFKIFFFNTQQQQQQR